MNIQIEPSLKQIKISELGLEINIKPAYILHQMMDENGADMLRKMVTTQMDAILGDLVLLYGPFQKGYFRQKELDAIKEKPIDCLTIFSIFVRQIVSICFSFDMDTYLLNKTQEEKQAVEWAFSIIAYNPVYGFKSSSITKIDLTK